jgi:hypothetical protein
MFPTQVNYNKHFWRIASIVRLGLCKVKAWKNIARVAKSCPESWSVVKARHIVFSIVGGRMPRQDRRSCALYVTESVLAKATYSKLFSLKEATKSAQNQLFSSQWN